MSAYAFASKVRSLLSGDAVPHEVRAVSHVQGNLAVAAFTIEAPGEGPFLVMIRAPQEKLGENGNLAQMTPHTALRKMAAILESTDAPHAKIREAEACLRRLWDYVLNGE